MLIARVLLIALLLTFTSATDARAGWKLERAQTIAEYVWHYDYGCENGIVNAAMQNPADAFDAAELGAMTSAGRMPLMWTHPEWAGRERCSVFVNAEWVRRLGLTWSEACSAMIHEYGHLAGLGHSRNPRSVMNERYRPDRRCRKRGRPFIERHGLALR